jgi:hypothetical protein
MSRITKPMIRRSHEAQFGGTDYQQAAVDVLQGLPFEPTTEEFAELESSPDPGCECGFCQFAEWNDD